MGKNEKLRFSEITSSLKIRATISWNWMSRISGSFAPLLLYL